MKWISERAKHIRKRNPDMEKSESYAIATLQGHATGKTGKKYGTAEGRAKAAKKYPSPEKYVKTANPKRSRRKK